MPGLAEIFAHKTARVSLIVSVIVDHPTYTKPRLVVLRSYRAAAGLVSIVEQSTV